MPLALHRLAVVWLKKSGNTTSGDDVTRRLAKNGAFHIARIGAFLWRGGDKWSNAAVMVKEINVLNRKPTTLAPYFQSALDAFKAVVTGNPTYSADLDGAMKSNNLDADIDAHVYKAAQVAKAAKAAKSGAKRGKAN